MTGLYGYNLGDLEKWAERIEEKAKFLGLDYYPQEFEVIDNQTMLDRKTYVGMLSFYPHWSSGKRHEINTVLYQQGLQYLPYELVVATNPCLACLRNDNDLAMQILTMAHVYGHNNFFKNNTHFQGTIRHERVFELFRSSADQLRSFQQNPSIGPLAVRKCLDSAHAIMWQPKILEFIRDNSPRELADWEKYIINTVLSIFDYLFRPGLKTIGMNEGWATYCHYKIVRALGLPQELRGAFAGHHSKVVRLPDNPRQYNHYLVNFVIWNSLEQNFQSSVETKDRPIPSELFEIMKEGNDATFLEKHLTLELAKELGLFLYEDEKEGDRITRALNYPGPTQEKNQSFRMIKEKIIESLGFNQIPRIVIKDPNHEGHRYLYLQHEFDGRYLEPNSVPKTLEYIYYFWPRQIMLATKTYNRSLPFIYEFDGTRHRAYRVR